MKNVVIFLLISFFSITSSAGSVLDIRMKELLFFYSEVEECKFKHITDNVCSESSMYLHGYLTGYLAATMASCKIVIKDKFYKYTCKDSEYEEFTYCLPKNITPIDLFKDSVNYADAVLFDFKYNEINNWKDIPFFIVMQKTLKNHQKYKCED